MSSLSARLLGALAGHGAGPAEPPFAWTGEGSRAIAIGRRVAGACAGAVDRVGGAAARANTRPVLVVAAALIALPLVRLVAPSGAPVVFAVALLAAVFGFGASLYDGADRRRVLGVLALGVALRLALGALIAWRGGFPDEWATYHPLAADAAACWARGGPSLLADHIFVENRATYFYLLSGAYYVAGSSLIVGRILGAAIGLTVALLAGECARAAAGRRAGMIAVALVALHPEHAFWAVTLSRDSLTALFVLTSLALVLRRPGTLTRGTLLLAAVPVALLWWNGFLFAGLLTATLLLHAFGEAIASAGRSLRGIVVPVAATALCLAAATFVGYRYGAWVRPELFTDVRSLGLGLDADFFPDLVYADWWDVFVFAPVGAVFVLAAPFPWDAIHANRAAYSLLAIPGLAVTVLGVFGLVSLARRRLAAATPLIVYAALVLGVLGLLEATTGIVVRHRLSLTAVLAVGAAVLLAGLGPGRETA